MKTQFLCFRFMWCTALLISRCDWNLQSFWLISVHLAETSVDIPGLCYLSSKERYKLLLPLHQQSRIRGSVWDLFFIICYLTWEVSKEAWGVRIRCSFLICEKKLSFNNLHYPLSSDAFIVQLTTCWSQCSNKAKFCFK